MNERHYPHGAQENASTPKIYRAWRLVTEMERFSDPIQRVERQQQVPEADIERLFDNLEKLTYLLANVYNLFSLKGRNVKEDAEDRPYCEVSGSIHLACDRVCELIKRTEFILSNLEL